MSPVHLGLVELDLLAANAGAGIPYPLRVPTFGRIPAERDVLFAAAGETLRQRALADDDGPTGLAATLATALRTRKATVDLVVTSAGSTVGTVAVIHGNQALLCRQTLDDAPDSLVEISRVRLENLVDCLADCVPHVPAAKMMPLHLPSAALEAARQSLTAGDNLDYQLHTIARQHNCAPDHLHLLVRAGSTVRGSGQLGATQPSRTGEDIRTGTELSWLDTDLGRLRVATQAGWTSINPLRPHDLRAEIASVIRTA